MISFSNINKQYGKQLLFVDASFQLNPGEKVGLVGPNGAGKTAPGAPHITHFAMCGSLRRRTAPEITMEILLVGSLACCLRGIRLTLESFDARSTHTFATHANVWGHPAASHPAPPTLRFPERTEVALRSDLAHDDHQNSNFLFRLR
jgi:ABC transporter